LICAVNQYLNEHLQNLKLKSYNKSSRFDC
ncbi:MAG: hypothetical protein ACJAWA_000315, partial [Nonlabens sp.]